MAFGRFELTFVQDIRKKYFLCGIAVLLAAVIPAVAALLCAVVFSDVTALNILALLLSYGALFAVCIVISKQSGVGLGLYEKTTFWDFLCAAAVAMFAYPMMGWISGLCASIAPESVLDSSSADLFMRRVGPFLSVLFLAVLPAFGEEMLCRGLLFSAFRKRSASWAVFVSALCFALLHGNLQQSAYAFAFGLLLGALREASGNPLPCVFAHGAFNAVSVLASFYPENYTDSGTPVTGGVPEYLQANFQLFWVGLLGVAFCVFWIRLLAMGRGRTKSVPPDKSVPLCGAGFAVCVILAAAFRLFVA